jgi:hypothetical protein
MATGDRGLVAGMPKLGGVASCVALVGLQDLCQHLRAGRIGHSSCGPAIRFLPFIWIPRCAFMPTYCGLPLFTCCIFGSRS